MNLPVRWRKAVRDLAKRPGRSLLTVLALAAGVFEVALVLAAYALLQPELRDFYGSVLIRMFRQATSNGPRPRPMPCTCKPMNPLPCVL